MKELDINSFVKVKLTPVGIKILKERHKNNNGKLDIPYKEPEFDQNGYASFQLWKLMNIFGEYIKAGTNTPFETIILVENKDLHEVEKPVVLTIKRQ